MRIRRVGAVSLATAVLALCVFADQPWKQKPYQKWTASEVRHILHNSPWAKAAQAPYSPLLNGDKPEVGTSVKVGTVPDTTLTDTPAEVTHTVFHPETTVIVRWNSSRTVREALFRDAQLSGVSEAEAKERFLNPESDTVEIVMYPAGGSLLPPSEPATLVNETSLTISPSGRQILAIGAKVYVSLDARGTRGYVFEFPRSLPDGSPIVPRDSSYIEFSCRMGVRLFRARFRPAEMVSAEGADIR